MSESGERVKEREREREGERERVGERVAGVDMCVTVSVLLLPSRDSCACFIPSTGYV